MRWIDRCAASKISAASCMRCRLSRAHDASSAQTSIGRLSAGCAIPEGAAATKMNTIAQPHDCSILVRYRLQLLKRSFIVILGWALHQDVRCLKDTAVHLAFDHEALGILKVGRPRIRLFDLHQVARLIPHVERENVRLRVVRRLPVLHPLTDDVRAAPGGLAVGKAHVSTHLAAEILPQQRSEGDHRDEADEGLSFHGLCRLPLLISRVWSDYRRLRLSLFQAVTGGCPFARSMRRCQTR